jgi:hypothetical protein
MRRFSAPSCRRPWRRALSSPRSPGGQRSLSSSVFSQTIRLSEWDQSTPEPGLADHGGKVVKRESPEQREQGCSHRPRQPPGSRLDLSGTRGAHHPMMSTAAVDAPCLVGRSGSPRAARYDRDATPKLRGKVGPTTTGPGAERGKRWIPSFVSVLSGASSWVLVRVACGSAVDGS